MHATKLRLFAVLVVTTVLCSSCLYSRMLSFKSQLASFDKYVSLVDNGSTLEFKKPVVRPDDITDLTGFPPSLVQMQTNSQQIHAYRYVSLSPVESTGTPTVLCFTMTYGSGGLKAFHNPSLVTEVLGTNLVVAAARAIGESSFNAKEYRLDWSTQSTNLQTTCIPSLKKMILVLGVPLTHSNTPAGIFAGYRFNLEGTNGILRTNGFMNAEFIFDKRNTLLRKGAIHIGKLKLILELPAVP